MEKRKCTRFEVQIPFAFSGTEIAGGGLVTSLSKNGCSVVSDESVRPNTFLALRLQLPEHYAPLKVEVAEVRWVNGMRFGVEFRHLRSEEQERLLRFITWVETTQNN